MTPSSPAYYVPPGRGLPRAAGQKILGCRVTVAPVGPPHSCGWVRGLAPRSDQAGCPHSLELAAQGRSSRSPDAAQGRPKELIMPRGGHARSGPAADPNSERSELGRNKLRDGWTDLPAKVTGRAPAFPLEEARSDELHLWKELWKRPQAAMWKRLHLSWQVAGYVRSFLESTRAGAPASLKTAVLRQEDTLGLSTVGLNALRWRITEDVVAARRATTARVVETSVETSAAPVRRLRPAVGE